MAIEWLNIAEIGVKGVGAGAGKGAGSAASRWRRVASSWKALGGGVALVLLCLSVYLPGLWSIPAVDRDEARFAQASRQMFESAAFPRTAPSRVRADFHDGGWVIPKIQERERLNKPPLIYWLQVASAWVFTGGDPMQDAIWMYRVPSVLAAVATVLITWRLGCLIFDPRAAWLGAAMLAVAPMIVWDAHQARSDSVMMACTAGAMWGLWGLWRREEKWQSGRVATWQSDRAGTGTGGPGSAHFATLPLCHFATFWLPLSAGIMTKGFVTPMVVGLAIVFLCWGTGRWRWVLGLRPAMGIVIVAAPLGAWLYFVAQYKGGLGSYAGIVWDEFFVRGVAGSKEGHFWPPGLHTVALAVLFWPGSLMTLAGFVRAWKRARGVAICSPTVREGAAAAAPGNPVAQGGGSASPGAKGWRWPRPPLRSGCIPGRMSGRAAELFLIAWIVPAWIVFELSPAKLLHYTMPMLPAVALLSARALLAGARIARDRWGERIWLAIGLAPIGVLGWALVRWLPQAADPKSADFVMAAAIFPLVAAIVLVVLFWAIALVCLVRGQRLAGSFRGMGLVAVGMIACLRWPMAWVMPFPGTKSVELINGLDDRPIAGTYVPDSLVFGTRGRIERLTPEQVAPWARQHLFGHLILPGDQWPELEEIGWRHRFGVSHDASFRPPTGRATYIFSVPENP